MSESNDLNLYRVAFVGSRKKVVLVDDATFVMNTNEGGAMRAAYASLGKSDGEFLLRYYQCDTIRQSAVLQSEAQRVAYLVLSK